MTLIAQAPGTLASYARVVAELEEAERGDGWLARCEEAGRYLALSVSFVDALARELRLLGDGPVLEVCAGDGSLAAALGSRGVRMTATDVRPHDDREGAVERVAAGEALRRHAAPVVLGSFVPIDSEIDREVLGSPHVRHYIFLSARVGGELGSAELWARPGWTCTPLEEVTRWMVSRHDVWLGTGRPILRHGEAWRLSRTSSQEGFIPPDRPHLPG